MLQTPIVIALIHKKHCTQSSFSGLCVLEAVAFQDFVLKHTNKKLVMH